MADVLTPEQRAVNACLGFVVGIQNLLSEMRT